MTNRETIGIINKHSFYLKKRYGQHFLTDEHVKNKIISACNLTKDDLAIEIGPGIGSLTKSLAGCAGKVCAVEIDGSLLPILEETLAGCGNVEIIHADILKTDIGALIKKSGFKNAKVAANLPYNVATAVITSLLSMRHPIESITVMVQKEVANRLMAVPGTKDYGSLTLYTGFYSEPCLVANVPVNSFVPRPKVDSAVIRLNILKEPNASVYDEGLFFGFIKAAFSQRRKTLVNCMLNNGVFGLSKEELEAVLIKNGFPAQIRGEALGLRDFEMIFNAIMPML